jgi:DNA-binding transcriptional LysR family regulator
MTKPILEWESRLGQRVKLRDLHILSTVVEWGSISKAAQRLGMSQPSVSQAMAGLEAALRVRLLDRSPRGIEPTIYTRALLKRGHVVFDELKQGIRDIEFLADPATGEVRIGCPESMTAAFVPAIIDSLSRQSPEVVVHVINAQTVEQGFAELRDRKVNLMLGTLLRPLSNNDVTAEVLCEDQHFVVAGTNSPWAKRRQIDLSDLVKERWILFPPDSLITAYLAAALRAKNLELPPGSVTSFSFHVRMQLLATGRFLTIMLGSVLRQNAKRWSLKALPVDIGMSRVPIALFTLKNRTLSPVVEVFIQHMRRVARAPN